MGRTSGKGKQSARDCIRKNCIKKKAVKMSRAKKIPESFAYARDAGVGEARQKILESLPAEAQNIFAAGGAEGRVGEKKSGIEIVAAQEQSFGEFSSPAPFALARELKKSPHAIAQELAKKISGKKSREKKSLDKNNFIETAEERNGYLNFRASNKFFSAALRQALEMRGEYGSSQEGLEEGFGETVGKQAKMRQKIFAVEYSDPNVGKPFHIGHIRGTILGESIRRLREFAGWKSFGYTYLGDSGAQVAKLVVALDEFRQMRGAKDEKTLLEYYKRIHEESQARPELEEKIRRTLELIEGGDGSTLKKVEEIRKISLRGFEKNWEMLGVEFDEVTGESFFIPQARETVAECLREGIASKAADGAVVLELESYGLPNTIIMRSNGTTLYLTRDPPREEWLWEKTLEKFGRRYDESLIITASEQNTHFRQMHKLFELLKRPYAGLCKHIGFGLVFLESGKISSREGRVVFLEDVLGEAIGLARKEILSRELPYSEKEVGEIARKVGVGSVKFAFLRVGAEKNITFDPKKATSFGGDTGAYLQYTCVRAKNILRKAVEEKILEKEGEIEKAFKKISLDKNAGKREKEKNDEGNERNNEGNKNEKNDEGTENNLEKNFASGPLEFGETEKKIISLIAEFPAAARQSARSCQPHSLCEFLLRFSAAFSEFYEKCPVLQAETRGKKLKRLAIVAAAQTVLENGLRLLGVEVPQRM